MIENTSHALFALLATYGYWAVFVCIAVESAGIPLPGETMLLTAAIYAGATERLNIPLVIMSAAAGAIVGDNAGYLLGREGGYRLLRRYGHYIRLDERRLTMGRYLFLRHGGKVVFFGRFVAVLRMWAAFLAGAHRMPWRRFLAYNAAGGVVWASIYGIGGYMLGSSVLRLGGVASSVTLVVGATMTVVIPIVLRRNEGRLAEEAERTLSAPCAPAASRQLEKEVAVGAPMGALSPAGVIAEAEFIAREVMTRGLVGGDVALCWRESAHDAYTHWS